MNRRKSNISPLVAARIRPVRRPPFRSASDKPAGPLRIARSHNAIDVTPPSPLDNGRPAEREELRQTADTLISADAALGRVHDLLEALSGLLGSAKEGRRRPPRAAAVLQQRIDSTLDAIDAIIDGAHDADNRPLPAGEWPLGATPRHRHAGRKAKHVDGPSDRAGGKRSARFLAILRSQGSKSVDRTDPAEILAIVEGSAAKIASQREQLDTFLNERVLPLLATLEVTEENIHANQSILHDADFATVAGQLTGGDVLLNLFHPDGPAARLTIRQEDE